MTPLTGSMTRKFTFAADGNGYMIYCNGKPIGGAGVKLPREKPLRGNQATDNRREFSEQAREEIRLLETGKGQRRFIDVIERNEVRA